MASLSKGFQGFGEDATMEGDSATAASSSAATMSIFARSAEATSLEDLLATHAPAEAQAANADALGPSATAPTEG
eukprot:5140560-Alexandrium_andersonii.AAC.1